MPRPKKSRQATRILTPASSSRAESEARRLYAKGIEDVARYIEATRLIDGATPEEFAVADAAENLFREELAQFYEKHAESYRGAYSSYRESDRKTAARLRAGGRII